MRASERAYATLLDEIQTGALSPGTVLGEVEQSTRLGVSRTPLREALRRLASDGLVAQASPRVTVVAGIDADDIRALFDLRRALETEAARLAAQRGDRRVFHALAAEFERVDTADADDYYALIARFDAAIDAAVDNPTSPRPCAASARTSCGSDAWPATTPCGFPPRRESMN